MAKISKPTANPIVSALLCIILELGHLINGQKRKWIMVLICRLAGTLLCCIPGIVIFILSAMDAHKIATRLKAGKEVDENEYAVPLLFKICKIIHKDAVLVE